MDVINYLLKLVILALPLFAIPALLKSSNSMLGKVYGVGQNLGNKLTGGMKEDANKRQQLAKMETSARRTTAGLDQNGNLITDNRRNRFRRWAGGRATRTDAQRQNREAEAKRLLEDDTIRDMNSNAERYVGVGAARGGEPRLNIQIDKMGLKRQIEEMEPAKLKLEAKKLAVQQATLDLQGNAAYKAGGASRDDFLRDQFRATEAGPAGDARRAALSDLAMQNGAGGRSIVGEMAAEAHSRGGTDAQNFAEHLGAAHYPALETSAPEVTDFINVAGAAAPGSSGADSFKKVTAQTIGKLDFESDPSKAPKALNNALSTAGAISDATLVDALSPVNSGSLPEGHRQAITIEARRRGLIP